MVEAQHSNRQNDSKDFFYPDIHQLHNPFLMADMDKAVERILSAISDNKSILVFGDYDVDGASSTAILSRYFLSIRQKILTYIPDRQKEGYGPNSIGFNNLINLGVKVIFTVDCGTLSFEPINFAQKKN